MGATASRLRDLSPYESRVAGLDRFRLKQNAAYGATPKGVKVFISRMIPDPTYNRTNLLGRSVGFVFHTPKFWSCKGLYQDEKTLHYNPYSYITSDGLDERILELRTNMRDYHASKCHWPYRHMSYRGYMYFHGKKRRYNFHYMGNPGGKIFSVWPQNRYTTWFRSKDAE